MECVLLITIKSDDELIPISWIAQYLEIAASLCARVECTRSGFVGHTIVKIENRGD